MLLAANAEIMTAASRQKQIPLYSQALHRMGIWTMLIALVIAGSLLSPKFLRPANLLDVLRNVTLLGIVAVGVAFITYGKHYVDLSIPAIMACSGMAAVSALPWGIGPGLACGLLAGLTIGLVNGYVVGYLRVNPIIWTLAVVFLLDGLLRMVYSGRQIYPDAGTAGGAAFLGLSQHNFRRLSRRDAAPAGAGRRRAMADEAHPFRLPGAVDRRGL